MDLFKKHPKVDLEKMLKATGQISKQHNTECNCLWGNGQDDLISVNYNPAQRKKSLLEIQITRRADAESRGLFLQPYYNSPFIWIKLGLDSTCSPAVSPPTGGRRVSR